MKKRDELELVATVVEGRTMKKPSDVEMMKLLRGERSRDTWNEAIPASWERAPREQGARIGSVVGIPLVWSYQIELSRTELERALRGGR